MTHAPPSYVCPFCLLAAGVENEHVWSRESDVVERDDEVIALIAAKQWPGTPGHVLIIPVRHFENLYTLPDELGARIHALSRRVALAMRAAYGCAGVSTRQHNEPAGNQDVWPLSTTRPPPYVPALARRQPVRHPRLADASRRTRRLRRPAARPPALTLSPPG